MANQIFLELCICLLAAAHRSYAQTLTDLQNDQGQAPDVGRCSWAGRGYLLGQVVERRRVCLETRCEPGGVTEFYSEGDCSEDNYLLGSIAPSGQGAVHKQDLKQLGQYASVPETVRSIIREQIQLALLHGTALQEKLQPSTGYDTTHVLHTSKATYHGKTPVYVEKVPASTRILGGYAASTSPVLVHPRGHQVKPVGATTKLRIGNSVHASGSYYALPLKHVAVTMPHGHEEWPKTKFSCNGRLPGRYALPEAPCKGYVECTPNVRLACPPGLAWDRAHYVCTYPSKASCKPEYYAGKFSCNGLRITDVGTFFPDPLDCSSYYVCMPDGIHFCPDGTSFDPSKGECQTTGKVAQCSNTYY